MKEGNQDHSRKRFAENSLCLLKTIATWVIFAGLCLSLVVLFNNFRANGFSYIAKHYVQDQRTGICFSYLLKGGLLRKPRLLELACVPCEEIRPDLLEKYPVSEMSK